MTQPLFQRFSQSIGRFVRLNRSVSYCRGAHWLFYFFLKLPRQQISEKLEIFLKPPLCRLHHLVISVFQFSAFTLLPDKIANGGYDLTVSASEIIQELPKLSDAERQAVLDKLRELAQVDDDRWEEIINEPTPRPKLQAFIEQATAEGSEPLDLNRM